MEDFRLIISKIVELMSIEIPILGQNISILEIVVGLSILSLVIGFVVRIFGGN